MKENYLITGSHGSIGSKLVERLGEENVIRGDRFCEFVPEVSHVVDLAAYGNIFGQEKDVYEIYRANLMRPISLLTAIASRDNIKSVILTSSSSVLLEHQTYYSQSKRAMEEMVLKMGKDYGLPIVIVRPATVTGPGEASNRFIPRLIDSCLNGTEMPFVSGPTHDFIDVRDVVNAILMLSVGSPEALGRVFNISGHKATSNQEVRSVVEKVTGKKANVKLVDSMRPYDNKNWLVDNSDLVRFGWKPQISLEESVKDMVEAYDK